MTLKVHAFSLLTMFAVLCLTAGNHREGFRPSHAATGEAHFLQAQYHPSRYRATVLPLAEEPAPPPPGNNVDNTILQMLSTPHDWSKQATRDEFAWRVFALICAPQPGSATNLAVWQGWAGKATTFTGNPAVKPVFPGGTTAQISTLREADFQRDPILKIFNAAALQERPAGGGFARAMALPAPVRTAAGQPEIVFRNEIAFNAIVNKGQQDNDPKETLWALAGLQELVTKNSAVSPMANILVMPKGSVEVKSMWADITCTQSAAQCNAIYSRYHSFPTVLHGKNVVLGLVGLHLMVKVADDAQQWLWATWEWAGDNNKPTVPDGNVGRCDYPCLDSYGAVIPVVKPQPNSQYAPGELTPNLDQLMAANHLGPEWRNYRLKGTQKDETPLRLGNSQIEASYVDSSSCSACHSRASIDANGEATDSATATKVVQPDGHVKGPVGPPRPTDFLDQNGNRAYYRTDSVWSFLELEQPQ